MLYEGCYPPGVTGKMIDEFYENDLTPPRQCDNCRYYEERNCGYICSILEAEYSETALGDMSDEEYEQKFRKNPYDYCKDHIFWED